MPAIGSLARLLRERLQLSPLFGHRLLLEDRIKHSLSLSTLEAEIVLGALPLVVCKATASFEHLLVREV